MIRVRFAKPDDATAIAAVHVAGWRGAYAGILPDAYLARMSMRRQIEHYTAAIRSGGVLVAVVADEDAPSGTRVVGFSTVGVRPRGTRLADGEIETLYVLDDWRDQGVGRSLMLGGAEYLEERGCKSVFLWVLRDNPSRWFYQRMGGKLAMESDIVVGGKSIVQAAYVWNPIERLTAAAKA